MSIRSFRTLRSWLFIEGADDAALAAGPASGADVLIQELEDFTPPALRPRARAASAGVIAAWKVAGRVAAVRVNPLDTDGLEDLEAVLAGAPDLILLPKANEAAEIVRLDAEIGRLERELGLPAGGTAVVPNVELARGLVNVAEICAASPRVAACLLASEDLAADLGAVRGRDGVELAYARARFHLECVAAGVLSIDCPYTWSDEDGLEAEARHALRLGYRAKSAVHPDHAVLLNRIFSPDPAALARARRIVAAFEAARESGVARVELDGSIVEVPSYLNARRLIARAVELENAGAAGGVA